MKKSYQPALDLNQQINNLKSINLIIEDESYAKSILERVSYYRLIKAYSITLKENGRYIDGTSFDNIVNLYLFDMELRHILFPLIEHVEAAILMTYCGLDKE